MGDEVRAGKRNQRFALVVDGVSSENGVNVVVLKNGLAGIGGHLGIVVLVLVAENVANERKVDGRVEAVYLARGLIELREEHRGARGAKTERARILDGLGPGICLDSGVIGLLDGSHELVECVLIDVGVGGGGGIALGKVALAWV